MTSASSGRWSPLAQAHALAEQGRFDEARILLVRLLAKTPGDIDAQMLMCFVCAKVGNFDQAAYYAQRVTLRLPEDPRAWTNLCNALMDAGRPADAVKNVQAAATRFAGDEALAQSFSSALMRSERPDLALAHCEHAVSIKPSIGVHANAAAAALACGLANRSVDHWRRALAIEPHSERLVNGLLTALNYAELAEHGRADESPARYGELLARLGGTPATSWNVDPDPDRRLRIGLLSPDLRLHAMSYFIEPLLRHHDGAEWEVYCYSTATREDDRSQLLRKLLVGPDRWKRLAGLRYIDAAETIRRDRIDVLIDMAGHTAGHALGAMHLAPAPVQMTWLGYPGSTGVPAIRNRIVDSITDPPAPAPWTCTEQPLRLDPCLAVWTPPDDTIPPAPPPCMTRGHVTFGSFSALPKLSDTTIGLWTAVLNAVPDSRLLFKTTGLAGPSDGVQRLVRERFAAAGADNARIDLEGPGSGSAEMLRQYARVDISLDTFPYQGTTTICESVWMGVPVVSLEGPPGTPASRVACSLLAAIGLRADIARDQGEFVSVARRWAQNPSNLATLRGSGPDGLRARMNASPLRDGPGMCRRLAAAVRETWKTWCKECGHA